MIAQHRTILFAGNSPGEGENIRCFLEKNSESQYQFIEARTGQETIELCRTANFDCLLMDSHLPDFNVVELLAEIERQFCASYFPIVILSESESVSDAVLSIRHGAHDYLVKNKTTPLELERAIESAIEKVRLHRKQKRDEQEAFWLAAIVESSDDVIISKNFDGTILSWNKGAEKLFGYTAEEVIGQNIRLLFPAELLVEEETIIEKVRQGERINHYETVRLGKDGSIISVSLTVSPIKDSFGNIVAVSKTVRDISTRKNAEAKLRDSEERYRELFEANPLPMWVYEIGTYEFLEVNESAIRHYGYSREEFLAMTIKDIRPAEDVSSLTKNASDFETTLSKAGVWQHRKKDGSTIFVEITSHRLDFQGKNARLVLANDVSARKKIEDALRESEGKLRLFVEYAPVSVAMFDCQMNYIAVSRKWMQEYELEGNVIGINHYDIFPEMPERWRQAHRKCLAGAVEKMDEEKIVRADGSDGWLKWEARPWFDAAEQIGGIIIFIEDITERKLTEAALRRMDQRLSETLDNMLEGYIIISRDWRILYLNNAAAPEKGAAKEKFLGKELAEVYPEIVGTRFYAAIKNCLEQGISSRIEEELKYANGESKWFEYIVQSTAEGVLILSLNITKRRRNEEALKFEKERLEKIASAAPSLLSSFRMSPAGETSFPYVSSAVEKIYGFSREEIENDSALVFDRVHPEDARQLNETIERSMLTMSNWTDTFRYEHPKKGTIWLEGFSSPVLEKDGSVIWHGILNDVTERVQAEETLRSEKARLEKTAAVSPSALFSFKMSPDGQYSLPFASPIIKEIYGFTPEELKIDCSPVIDRIHPSDVDEAFAKLKESTEKMSPYHGLNRYLHPQKGEIWIESSSAPVLESDGSIVWHGVMNDVTERIKAEEKIVESEKRYRLMFENNPLPMWVASYESLDFLAANDAAINAYGYSRAEFLAMNVRNIRPPEEIPTFLDSVAEFKGRMGDVKSDGMEKPFVMRHSRKDGTLLDVEIIAHVIIFDGKLAVLIMANDITERLRAETALKEAGRFNEQIITYVQEGIIVFDKDLRFVVWNKFLEDLTGVSYKDLIGKKLTEISSVEFEKNVYESLERALNGETVRAFDNQIKIPSSGEFCWAESSFAPNYTASSEIGGVIATISDIGERKKYEQEIIRFNESLEHKVAARTAELNAVNSELESFSYSVSHDLRAPLRAMDGFSLALLEDYADKIDETGQNYLQRVRNASKEMARLIDDILLLSRITRSEIVKKDVNLSETAGSIVRQLQETQPRGNVEFEIEPNVHANGDERLLKVALENLLGNAYKFTAKNENAKIIFGQKQNGKGIEYFIKDNGAGFDMAYADKLFGAFQRLHSTAEFEGTGIGLATVQRVIRKHGGRIRAEGKVGEGASFYFTI